MSHRLVRVVLPLVCLLLAACVAPPRAFDYAAYRQADPASILILPPLNNSPDVMGGYSVLSVVTAPLAEAGYYVYPVAVVDETFRQNGLSNAAEMHDVSLGKLHEIFGADAVLYLTVSEYGARYMIFQSEVRVTVDARLIDLRSGQPLWEGSATASTAENQNNNSQGLVGMLVQALVEQVMNNLTDNGHQMADVAGWRLLSAGRTNGILYGPRSHMYGKDGMPR